MSSKFVLPLGWLALEKATSKVFAGTSPRWNVSFFVVRFSIHVGVWALSPSPRAYSSTTAGHASHRGEATSMQVVESRPNEPHLDL